MWAIEKTIASQEGQLPKLRTVVLVSVLDPSGCATAGGERGGWSPPWDGGSVQSDRDIHRSMPSDLRLDRAYQAVPEAGWQEMEAHLEGAVWRGGERSLSNGGTGGVLETDPALPVAAFCRSP